jgi:hypothetical protein
MKKSSSVEAFLVDDSDDKKHDVQESVEWYRCAFCEHYTRLFTYRAHSGNPCMLTNGHHKSTNRSSFKTNGIPGDRCSPNLLVGFP